MLTGRRPSMWVKMDLDEEDEDEDEEDEEDEEISLSSRMSAWLSLVDPQVAEEAENKEAQEAQETMNDSVITVNIDAEQETGPICGENKEEKTETLTPIIEPLEEKDNLLEKDNSLEVDFEDEVYITVDTINRTPIGVIDITRETTLAQVRQYILLLLSLACFCFIYLLYKKNIKVEKNGDDIPMLHL